MGGHEDPEDGGAVAGAVFGAVFIYIVGVIWEADERSLLTMYRVSLSSAACRPSFTCARAVAEL